MNTRRSFFSSLLGAACASMLRFYPAPEKPKARTDYRVIHGSPLIGFDVGVWWDEDAKKVCLERLPHQARERVYDDIHVPETYACVEVHELNGSTSDRSKAVEAYLNWTLRGLS